MIERQIIIGLITSSDYCAQMKNVWNSQFLESTTAKRLAGWVWEYYNKYNKAPGKDIEAIFFSKIKASNFPKTIAEEIEQDILPELSKQYEQEGLDVKYLIDETKKYFNEQHIKQFTESVQSLLDSGQLDEAEKLVGSFKPLASSNVKLDQFIRNVAQIRKIERQRPACLMKPWLFEGHLIILYGSAGTGKSLLAILIGYLLGVKDYDIEECEIGQWQVHKNCGCLYVDGELGELDMEARIKGYEWIGTQRGDCRIKVLSAPEYQLATEDTFSLSDRTNQLKIIHWLKEHPNYKLIILDSLSTLFSLDDENNNSEWNKKVNPFLRDLRALGVSCILLHHSGKDKKKGMRGASAMEAMAQYIFRLTNHPKASQDSGEAWFIISKDKQRAGGKSFPTFALHFSQDVDGNTHWEETELK